MIECIHDLDGKAWIQMSKKTHTNPLSKREVEQLRKNPYVASASANTVRFTEEFKALAYDAKCKGVSVYETMRRTKILRILHRSRKHMSFAVTRRARGVST